MVYEKIYVVVIVRMEENGGLRPIKVLWQDGRAYDIDRVLDVRRAPAKYVGGMGTRYTCRICGDTKQLFLDDSRRWFVEKAVETE